MTLPPRTLEIRSSPHILSGYSVDTIMFNVVLALIPTVGFAIFAYGLTRGADGLLELTRRMMLPTRAFTSLAGVTLQLFCCIWVT